jgi:poly-gamma-glutamate capsule biosynthesis protein CapA/YwtB (metallophosphatase superfamily)
MSRMIDYFVNDTAKAEACSLLFTGDVILDVADADHWLSGIAPVICSADIAVAHLEVPHSARGGELQGDIPAPAADPRNLEALARAGFAAVTLAGNHIADCGPDGIADTIAGLDKLGIEHSGAGMTLAEARRPAILTCDDRTIALLSYNCVGPEGAWAGERKAGCAYLRIETEDGSPIAPANPLSRVTDEAIAMLQSDIAKVRKESQLVVVALHKGIVHTPARLAPYEREIAHVAIDAGADVVVGHHAHIIRGVEFYKSRPIFHGLGNGCVVTHALSPDQDHAVRAEWARRRKEMFGFEPDPAYTLAPFHPEAVNAMFGRLLWHPDGRIEVGFIPIDVEPPGRPVVPGAERGAEIQRYFGMITRAGGLPAIEMVARDDMVALS